MFSFLEVTNTMDKSAYLLGWAEDAPDEVWQLLEDWGYFKQDVNARDIANLSEYLLERLSKDDAEDYYSCLQNTDYSSYLKVKTECIYYIYYYKNNPDTERQGSLQQL